MEGDVMAEIILKNVSYQYPLEEKEVVRDFKIGRAHV